MFGHGPGEPALVVRWNPRTRERTMDKLVWGLLPHDANPATSPRPLHARAETVATLPLSRTGFSRP